MKKAHLFVVLNLILLSGRGILPSAQAASDPQKTELKEEKTVQGSEEPALNSDKELEENSSEALEMIALRMKSLSSSLNEMPDIPQLNQTIQLPLGSAEENTSASPEDSKPSKNLN